MKRKLIQQMRNEWRSNIWMCVELIITGLVLWAIFSTFLFLNKIHRGPEDYDLTDIYMGYTGEVDENANTYSPYPDSLHNIFTDYETLISNLRNNPYVESIGGGNNAMPYSYNYSGNLFTANINGTTQTYSGNIRHMTPDLVRTIRLTGIHGESTEELAEMIENGQTIISLFEKENPDCNPEEWRGRDVYWSYDSTRVEHIGAIVKGIRRSDYEPIVSGMMIMKHPSHWLPYQVVIRVKPGKGDDFMASLKAEDLEFGNIYITNIGSIESLRDVAHMNIDNTITTLTVSALFIMIAVFLGFLGSFWFRTQQRVPELALRRVNGATRRDLFRRLLAEGMILLAVSLPFMAILGYLILSKVEISGVLSMQLSASLSWGGLAISVLALALMITAGLSYPALIAMKVNPADALKYQ